MRFLRRTVSAAVLILAAGLAGPSSAESLRGVALVIGLADYEGLADLGNASRDADGMDEMLDALGFEVTTIDDRRGERDALVERIERFLDDAEGADVALVYYAGHAVQAAGQNYLVPIDANLSTPARAGESLVPLDDLLDHLARTVPVTIMLLDACRTEAFPGGAVALLPGAQEPVAIGGDGLMEMRGPTPVLANIDPDSLGMVIGFAAAPGQAALDGEPGGNSPYAAALLKHMSAGSYAFGDLMTMVTEEVYLKTGARQVPWTNSSLRRVLSFGDPVEAATGDEALISEGRRKLLLSIAATPAGVRRQVEMAASGAAVPMDTLYGLLDALGQDAPTDPAALDQLFKSQIETIRKVMEERRALTSADPEILRLAELAQRALDEGALDVSVAFWERVKARYAEVSVSLDATEAMLKERRLEGGALLARTAEAYMLAGDHELAAENYMLAAEEVARWDEKLSVTHRFSSADALAEHGYLRGDPRVLQRAAAIYRETLDFVAEEGTDRGVSAVQNNLGRALMRIGELQKETALFHEAIAAFQASLDGKSKESEPLAYARTQLNLGVAYSRVGQRTGKIDDLLDAVAIFERGIGEDMRAVSPETWALSRLNLGGTLTDLFEQTGEVSYLERSIATLRPVVTDTAVKPDDRADVETNLANALIRLGERSGEKSLFIEAVETLNSAATYYTRERAPAQWSRITNALGMATGRMAESEPGTERLLEALQYYQLALDERRIADSPIDWAESKANIGGILSRLGEREASVERHRAAVAAYEESLTVLTPETSTMYWAMVQNNLANTLTRVAEFDTGTENLTLALEAFDRTMTVWSRDRSPHDWARAQSKQAYAMGLLGQRSSGIAELEAAVKAYQAVLEVWNSQNEPARWATIQDDLGWLLGTIGLRTGDAGRIEAGREAINAARAVYGSGNPQYDAYFDGRIAALDEARRMVEARTPPAE